jgi:ribosomal protein S18 acetylase RimI-like enzyme
VIIGSPSRARSGRRRAPPLKRGGVRRLEEILQERDPSPDLTIRPSTPADAEELWYCLGSVASERRHIAMVEPPTLEEVQSFLRTLAERGVIQFVAHVSGQVVGWCDVSPKPIEGFRHSAVLGMGLLQRYRGRGLGTVLLRAVLGEARLQGLSRIELEVYTSNQPAIALYERFGFAREGIKRSARILDGHVEDILCMALLLTPLKKRPA